MLVIVHAVENAGGCSITPAEVFAILRGDGGRPSHVHTVFSDVSLQSLASVGAADGITLATILASYRAARSSVAAANAELAFFALAEPW